MSFSVRKKAALKKACYYAEEVLALGNAGIGYRIGVGVLLIILFPLFLLELAVLIILGKDMGMFVSPDPVEYSVFIEEEVPERLRDLIPLAKKYGVSDDGDREEILNSSSSEELKEIEQKVIPKAQEIADWLDSFPEGCVSDTAAYFLYLGSACDETSMHIKGNET